MNARAQIAYLQHMTRIIKCSKH